jgi:CP family cyanate transporter-like MFS transporter
LATRTIGRWGSEATVFACLAGVLAGIVLRSAGPAWMVLAGTAVIGLSLTLGNIVVPVIIRREVPWDRVSLATGLYSAGMNVGSMATLIGTGPLAAAVGWRWALALWSVLAVVGMAYWLALVRRRLRTAPGRQPGSSEAGPASAQTAPTARSAGGRPTPPFRRVTWLLVIAFSGQSAGYYTTTTWLPSILADSQGVDTAGSGATASLFQVAAIVGALGVPLLAARTRPWVPMAVVAALWLSLPLGLLLAPDAYTLWSLTGGVAQGGGFTAIFSIIARMAGNDSEAAAGSAFVQTGGYLAATITPPLAGWLHTATAGWTAPILLVLAATLAFTIAGLLAVQAAGRMPGPRQRGSTPA